MKKPLALAALLTLGASPSLAAQAVWYARIGATGASALLHDQVIAPIDTKQAIAPTIAAGASLRLAPRYGVGIEAAFATGGYHVEEAGLRTDLGSLRTLSALLNIDGPILGPLRWRVGVGTITYMPADKTGIFASGGTTRPLFGAGVDFRHPAFSQFDLMASARYDYHRFTTDALKARSFGQSQQVSRVSLTIGLAHGAF
jgi:hypothetical protein